MWRGTLGRRKAEDARDFKRRTQALVPYVVMFQRIYRGNQSRKTYKYVADAIRTMYDCRQREASVGCGESSFTTLLIDCVSVSPSVCVSLFSQLVCLHVITHPIMSLWFSSSVVLYISVCRAH